YGAGVRVAFFACPKKVAKERTPGMPNDPGVRLFRSPFLCAIKEMGSDALPRLDGSNDTNSRPKYCPVR
ncbi:MAG: hypothetical protein P8Z69_08735, partial [Acidihalobacter sp.]